MPGRVINTIVIHCAASVNGVSLARLGQSCTLEGIGKTAAQVINGWHRNRGFNRTPTWRRNFNTQLGHVGYHYVIDTDGVTETCRHRDEQGAHALGHNLNSLGICIVGTDKFSRTQWLALRELVRSLLELYPNARVCGHRDLSPDANGDGKVTPNEWCKTCPGFDVTDWWLMKSMQPMVGHILETKP